MLLFTSVTVHDLCISPLFFFSAYEVKQHSKRKEISSRSWFSSPAATPGGAAGSLLHRLSMQGKEAAMAKSFSTSQSPLIIKRTGGPGFKTEPSATVTRGNVDPEVNTHENRTQKQLDSNGDDRAAEVFQKSETNVVKPAEEVCEGQINHVERKVDRSGGAVASLVADYSDSDSDGGQ